MKAIKLNKNESRSFLKKASLYILLVSVGFVYIYPIIKMISKSLMNPFDTANPLVKWVPTQLYFENYLKAFKVMGGMKTLFGTVVIMLLIAAAQTFSAALIAYGFAKFDFWGKKVFFILMVATFMLPTEVTMLPNYVMFKNYGMLHTILPMLLPSLLGQGIRHSLFILIFYQFFSMSPKSLDEAAYIDGAGIFKTFWKINLRMTTPAMVVAFVFSFVWNWNETNLTASYFGNKITTVTLALQNFKATFEKLFPSKFQGTNINSLSTMLSQGIEMAGTFLSIIPLIIVYLCIERKLVESIDKSGITGE